MVTVRSIIFVKQVNYEWCLVFFVQQEDDDTDPLDAFMADVNKEVKYLNECVRYHQFSLVILNCPLFQTQNQFLWI